MPPTHLSTATPLLAPEHPPLLHHLGTVRAPLFAFLSPRDVIQLLATSRALRSDAETVAFALQTTTEPVSYVLRDCLSEWCTPASSDEDNDDDYARDYCIGGTLQGKLCPCKIPRKRGPSRGRRHLPPLAMTLDSAISAYPDELASPERRVSLLSLATQLATTLDAQLYKTHTPNVTQYTMVPFILPLDRLRQLEPLSEEPTALGCHIENCSPRKDGGHNVDCALCDGLVAVKNGCLEYHATRRKEEEELRRQMVEEGESSFSLVSSARWNAFRLARQAVDEEYGYPDMNTGSTEEVAEMLLRWGKNDKLPPLNCISEAETDDLDEALHPGFFDETYGRGYFSFCRKTLRPLAVVLRGNGFGRLQRTKVEIAGGCLTWQDELKGVEMIGAVTPHGFFAGAYFVAMYT
jgi:hypothetical protein